MNLKELQGFYEAYMNVYEDVEESEELDEAYPIGDKVKNKPIMKVTSPEGVERSKVRKGASGPSDYHMHEKPREINNRRFAQMLNDRGKEREQRIAAARLQYATKRGIERATNRSKDDEVPTDYHARKRRASGRPEMQESYEVDNYDLVLEYLLDEGFCETEDKAEAMMAHMSEGWIESIIDEAKCDEGLSDAEKEMKRKQRGNGGPTSHNLRQGKKTRGNMSHKYESGKYQD